MEISLEDFCMDLKVLLIGEEFNHGVSFFKIIGIFFPFLGFYLFCL